MIYFESLFGGVMLVLLQEDQSPLKTTDIINADKQDDGRAYRFFSTETLERLLRKPSCKGLAVYCFVLGELVDAFLNRTAHHLERIKMAYTAYYFIVGWAEWLEAEQKNGNTLLSFQKNFVSGQMFRIVQRASESLLKMICCYRKFFEDYPLLPWKYGTEAVEHLFGWMRVLLSDFTLLDARQLYPKLLLVSRMICTGKVKLPDKSNIKCGYQPDFFKDDLTEEEVAARLRQYPTNIQIRGVLEISRQQALQLLNDLGIETENIEASSIQIPEEENDDSEGDEDEDEVSISPNKLLTTRALVNPAESEQAVAASASFMQDRAELLQENDSDDQDLEVSYMNNSTSREVMSITSIFNPNVEETSFLVRDLSNHLVNSSTGLNVERLLLARKKHDSRVKRHQGNERPLPQHREKPNENEDMLANNLNEKLKPREASKLVAILTKSDSKTSLAGIQRRHRWDIRVKLEAIRNGPLRDLAVDTRLHYQAIHTGNVDVSHPIEFGSYAIAVLNGTAYIIEVLSMFEYKSKKHSWVQKTGNIKSLSYVCARVFYYKRNFPIALCRKTIDSTVAYTHLEASRIVFVFRPEHGLCATNNDTISLPTAAFPKVNAFHETVFCTSFEKSLKQKKVANRRGEQDEE